MGVVSSEMVTAVNMFLFFLEAKSWPVQFLSVICMLPFGDRINEMTMGVKRIISVHFPNSSSIARTANLFLINRPLAYLIFSSFMLEAMNEVLWWSHVDGSFKPWTEVVFHRRKLYCEPWTEVVSHATPPHLVKAKINFDEARSGFISTARCSWDRSSPIWEPFDGD